MVQLEEVQDEDYNQQQAGPRKEEEEDWDTSDGMHIQRQGSWSPFALCQATS